MKASVVLNPAVLVGVVVSMAQAGVDLQHRAGAHRRADQAGGRRSDRPPPACRRPGRRSARRARASQAEASRPSGPR